MRYKITSREIYIFIYRRRRIERTDAFIGIEPTYKATSGPHGMILLIDVYRIFNFAVSRLSMAERTRLARARGLSHTDFQDRTFSI